MDMNRKNNTDGTLADSNKAILALRTQGLSKEACEKIIQEECLIASGLLTPQYPISPSLVEMFGADFASEALSYAYFFMDQYGLTADDYEIILKTLLTVLPSEEVVSSPEKVKMFITNIRRKAYFKMACGDNDSFHSALIAAIDDLGNYKNIEKMLEDPDIIDEMAPVDEEIEDED